MTNKERRDAQMAYIADAEVFEDIKRARRLTHKLNTMDPADFEGQIAVAKELLQTEENPILTPPFRCDVGTNIIVGKNFGANYNCTFLDVAKITFGDNCVIGAGSVVTKDIPAWSLAAGNPARVIREIGEDDIKYYYKGCPIEEQDLAQIEFISKGES